MAVELDTTQIVVALLSTAVACLTLWSNGRQRKRADTATNEAAAATTAARQAENQAQQIAVLLDSWKLRVADLSKEIGELRSSLIQVHRDLDQCHRERAELMALLVNAGIIDRRADGG
jgi:chromosome segregation ATPase